MLDLSRVETYVPHSGTIRVGGSTGPKIAGKCAFHFYDKKVPIIDFVCIGANANQQATKAMGVFRYMLIGSVEGLDVSFQPLLFKANVPIEDIGEQDVYNLTTENTHTYLANDFKEATSLVRQKAGQDDVIFVLGAGDVLEISDDLIKGK